ncbi:MAG: diguanylate cyclase [Thermodesulfovibrionales bacterium]|nr:diguanylate cyclase [Thermodesulfovibrionales bacterium]
MSLHKKTLAITVLTIGSLMLVLFLIARFILLNSAAVLEEQEVRKNVERVLYAFREDLATLNNTADDWAAWDDTYSFVNGEYDDYVKVNLVDSTFVSQRLNLVLFLNVRGRMVFGKAFNLPQEEAMPVPEDIQQHLVPDSPVLRHTDLNSNVSGIILLKDAPMLVSSWPIRTSGKKGPIRGTLIFGRYFDSPEVKRLAAITNLSFTLSRLDDQRLLSAFMREQASFSGNPPVLIRPVSAEKITGHTFLNNIYGKPVVLLNIKMPRTIYQQGRKSLFYFLLSLAVTGLVFIVLTVFLFEKQVLSRLLSVHKSIRAIRKSGDLSLRVPVQGSDELSSLKKEINKMLETQEQTQKVLKASSLSDELTGLYNRRGFFSFAEQQLKVAERMKRGMLLLYGDVDNLKIINDTLGHLEGDRTLRDTAKIFKETFRESDIVARIGGDEFAVLTEMKEEVNAEVLTSRLGKSLNSRNTQEGRLYKIALSIGISYYDPQNPCVIEQLLAEADRNMYEQKREKQENGIT